jgi:hypothetical protein
VPVPKFENLCSAKIMRGPERKPAAIDKDEFEK